MKRIILIIGLLTLILLSGCQVEVTRIIEPVKLCTPKLMPNYVITTGPDYDQNKEVLTDATARFFIDGAEVNNQNEISLNPGQDIKILIELKGYQTKRIDKTVKCDNIFLSASDLQLKKYETPETKMYNGNYSTENETINCNQTCTINKIQQLIMRRGIFGNENNNRLVCAYNRSQVLHLEFYDRKLTPNQRNRVPNSFLAMYQGEYVEAFEIYPFYKESFMHYYYDWNIEIPLDMKDKKINIRCELYDTATTIRYGVETNDVEDYYLNDIGAENLKFNITINGGKN